MTGIKVIPNPIGIAELGLSPGMVAEVRDLAEKLRARVIEIADAEFVNPTGAYVAGLEIESGVEDGHAFARVKATDPASGYIEFGTSDTPVFQPIRKAAESFEH